MTLNRSGLLKVCEAGAPPRFLLGMIAIVALPEGLESIWIASPDDSLLRPPINIEAPNISDTKVLKSWSLLLTASPG